MPLETKLRHSLSLGLALTTLLTTELASAFCRTTTCRETSTEKCDPDDSEPPCKKKGFPLYWRENGVEYNLNRGGTSQLPPKDARDALLKAFGSWNGVICPDGGESAFYLVPGPETDESEVLFNEGSKNNINVIFFRENGWPYKGIDGTLATTSVSFDVNTGEIWDADIAINAAFNQLTTTTTGKKHFDVESIVVHEVGHFVGINHSGDAEALMAPTYNEGDIRRSLRPDDKAALCDIYPPGRIPPAADEGCSTGRSTGNKQGATPWGFALLSIPGLVLWRRRHRNKTSVRLRRGTS
ncbi:MAG: matrixin family metalloprotease [Polyangiaceae bacterium]